MFIIGITGNICGGKSTAARILADMIKAPIVDADKIVRQLVEPGQEALVYIASNFGEEVISDDGTLNKRKLGSLLISNIEARNKLNSILFPLVRKRVLELFNMYGRAGEKYLVYDAPLLFENGTNKLVDYTTIVYVPRDIQIKRIQDKNNLTSEQASVIVELQSPLEELLKNKVDYIIRNTSNYIGLNAMISILWKNIESRKKTHALDRPK